MLRRPPLWTTPERPCQGCGGVLPAGSHPGRRWCSGECGDANRRLTRDGWSAHLAQARPCDHCGGDFKPKTRRARFCCPECNWRYRADRRPRSEDWAQGRQPERVLPCIDCGEDVVTRSSRTCCEQCRASRKVTTNRRKNVKRRGARVGIRYTLVEIGDRDGWKCHLCRRSVNRTLPGTHDRGPTIDHLNPLAAGGKDEPVNVALAHRACNVKRRHKGIAQLRLTG